MISKLVVGLAAGLVSFSALAVQKDITVTANVDSTLEMTHESGAALPSAVAMTYYPGQGLGPQTINTKIYSNDASKDMEIRLVNSPTLVAMGGANPTSYPLKVTYAGKPLSTSAVTLAAGDVFPGGDTSTGSVVMPLQIAQATSGVMDTGSYSGVVSIALVHAAGAL